MSDYYDPGYGVRTATLKHLTGLKSIGVAVTNVHTNREWLQQGHCPRLALQEGKHVWMDKREEHKGSKDIVRVTVDQSGDDWFNALELERLIKKNVEMAFGYHDLCCVQECKPFCLHDSQF